MKRLTHTLLLIFCLFTPLAASVFDLEIGGDFLLWKECSDDLDFALLENEYHSLSSSLEPGVRVYVSFPELYLQGSCEYMRTNSNKSIESDSDDIQPALGHAALLSTGFSSAEGSYTTEYYGWDGVFSYSSDYECGNFIFSPCFGVAGIYLTQEVESEFNTLKTTWDSALWAVGFKCGADCIFKISENLFIYGQSSGVILGGEARRGHNLQVLNDTTHFRFDDGDRCHLIPGLRVALGMSMDIACCNTPIGLHFGWELLRYYNVPNPRIFMGDQIDTQAVLSMSPSLRTIGYQGLVVGGDILF